MVVITLQGNLYQVLHFLHMFCWICGSLLNKIKILVNYFSNRHTVAAIWHTMPVFGWDYICSLN